MPCRMAAEEAWDGKLEVEDYTARFVIGGGLGVRAFGEVLKMEMKETVRRSYEECFAERTKLGAFGRPVEMEDV